MYVSFYICVWTDCFVFIFIFQLILVIWLQQGFMFVRNFATTFYSWQCLIVLRWLRSTWCFDPVTVWNWSKQPNLSPVREGVHSLLDYFPVSHLSPLLLCSFPVSHLSPLLLHSFPVSHPSPVTLFLWVIHLLFSCESPISCYTLPVSHASFPVSHPSPVRLFPSESPISSSVSLSLWITHLLCYTLSPWVTHLLCPQLSQHPQLEFHNGGDNHGIVTPGGDLKVGMKVWLIPGHCDPTVNLHDWIVGVRNGRVECVWPVSGRGPGY